MRHHHSDQKMATQVLRGILVFGILCGSIIVESVQAQASNTPTPEQRFFEWSELKHDSSVYKDRRDRLTRLMEQQNVDLLLVPSAHGVSHGSTFRQEDDFLYFTGLELPLSIFVLDVQTGTSAIFAPRRDVRFESSSRTNDFPGRPLSDDPEIAERSGIDHMLPYEEFRDALSSWVSTDKSLSVNLGRLGPVVPIQRDFIMDWNPVSTLLDRIYDEHPMLKIENAYGAIAKLRMVKQPEEIEIMRRVAAVTAAAIRHAAGFVTDGVDERTLEAELEAVYKRRGAQRLSFASIIKSGPNSLWPWRILAAHHDRRNRIMRDGDLVIFDVGTELDYYISDVGRTFPVSGSFTDEQAEKLAMSTAVSDAIINAVRPGITLLELKEIAVDATPEHERPYMQTGSYFGHHIGMAAGDPNLMDAPLEPGMIFTVEPWYYNHDDNISVFVEDIVLVTADGAEVLTASLPRTPSELEKLVGN